MFNKGDKILLPDGFETTVLWADKHFFDAAGQDRQP